MSDPTAQILRNAETLRALKARVEDTFRARDQSTEKRAAWQNACAALWSSYDALAFPGGYDGAPERLQAGDPETVEAALCFLECRPYFFRSGYMFAKILRRMKHAPLSPPQQARLDAVVGWLAEWKAKKAASRR